ncbi:MAG: rod shape-determining protein RodA [Acetivibrionales bacterium]
MYFVEKIKGINFFKRFDYLLFVSVLALSTIGLLALHSATHTDTNSNTMKVQIASIVMGITLALIVSAFDYKDFKTIGIGLYVVSVILLILVLYKGVGYQTWGSRSWLNIPFLGTGFQPSEISKITVILVTALYFERISEGQGKNNVLKLLIAAIIPVVLVVLQPDFGTAMVFVFMLMTMFFIHGIKYRYIFITIAAFMAAAPFAWFFILNDKRKDRILTFLYPEREPLGAGFQVIRSKMAIGSGQIFGKGLYNGIQTQNNGVPVQESDFIFTVIGEELGFIGSMVVILLVFFIILRCIFIAMNSRDMYGSFLVIGLTGMMAFHFIENIGMCIGILPVTGIPLPFVSAGGSAMVTNYFAIGIILSVSIRRRKAIFNSEN